MRNLFYFPGLIALAFVLQLGIANNSWSQDVSIEISAIGSPADYFISNNNTGVDIGSCTFDLSTTTTPGLFFDTIDAGSSLDFVALIPAQIAEVGLVSPESDGVNDGDVPDSSTSFTMTFNDFNPGEEFGFDIDVDPGGIDGAALEGATFMCSVLGTSFSCQLQAIAGTADSSCTMTGMVTVTPTTAIPTLSEWAMIFMVIGLGFLGAMAIRRMRAAN